MKGHIRRRGKDSWALVIDLGRSPGGKRLQKWHTVRGKKSEAEAELRRLLTAMDGGTYVEPNKLTVSKYLQQWLELVQPNVAPKTYARYAEIVNKHLIPALGQHRLMKLNGLHIEAYYAEARKSGRLKGGGGLSERTLLHHHRVLNEALRRAVRLKLRAGNPAQDVDAPKPSQREVNALDEQQTASLLKAATGTSIYAPILVAVTTGLRLGELLALRWSDVDLDGGIIKVRRTLQRIGKELVFKDTPKTRSSARKVSMLALTTEALRTHKAEQNKERLLMGPDYARHGLVFARADGSPWAPDTISKAFGRLARSQGLEGITFHTLRHSHASHLLRQNVHMKVASERLGHSTIKITMDLYSHLLDGMQDEAAAKVDSALREAMEGDKGA